MAVYRNCVVPKCESTTYKCPNKLFIHVPKCPRVRKQWLELAGRNPKSLSAKSAIFFCEDHFDLPNDMENYTQYRIMGSVSQKRMKPNCLPSKFQCQVGSRKRSASPPSAVNMKQFKDIHKLPQNSQIPVTLGMICNNNKVNIYRLLYSGDEGQGFNLKIRSTKNTFKDNITCQKK